MAHDREFQRKRKDTRMPVRDSHGEDQPAARQTEQDFDLRRARDTPSSVNGKTHRQDIPVQTEFSQLSPETPVSLLEQGDAYAAALDVFSDRFEIPDATGTESPTQDNGRSNFRQEVSRRSFVTEDVTDRTICTFFRRISPTERHRQIRSGTSLSDTSAWEQISAAFSGSGTGGGTGSTKGKGCG